MSKKAQKNVEAKFHAKCYGAKVPLKENLNSKITYLRGSFTMGYACGKMRVEYVYPNCEVIKDMSGYLSPRDMADWLDCFHPNTEYAHLKSEDKNYIKYQEKMQWLARMRDGGSKDSWVEDVGNGETRRIYRTCEDELKQKCSGFEKINYALSLRSAVARAGEKKIYAGGLGSTYMWIG